MVNKDSPPPLDSPNERNKPNENNLQTNNSKTRIKGPRKPSRSSSDETDQEKDSLLSESSTASHTDVQNSLDDDQLNENSHKNIRKKRKKPRKDSKLKHDAHSGLVDSPDSNAADEEKQVDEKSKGNAKPPARSTSKSKSSPKKKATSLNETEEKSQLTSPTSTSTTEQSADQPPLSISVVQEPVQKLPLRRPRSGRGGPRFKSKPIVGRKKPRMMPVAPATPPAQSQEQTPEPDKLAATETLVEEKPTELPRERIAIEVSERDDWRARGTKYPKDLEAEEAFIKLPAMGVVFVTNNDVDECKTWDHCAHEVRRIQNHHMDVLGLKDIAYNWLIGEDLTVFEGLGWDRRSPAARNKMLNLKVGHDIYIGFLGRYTPETIPVDTLNRAIAFIYLSMETKHIVEDYDTAVYEELQIIDEAKYDFIQHV